MTSPARVRAQAVLGAALGVVALGSTRDLGLAPYVVPPLVLVAVVLQAWSPVAGGGLLVAATVIGHALGVTPEHVAVLAAWLPVLYVVGRHASPSSGGLVLAGAIVASWVPDPTVADLLFGCVLLGAPWTFGRLVRERADRARVAVGEHAALAEEDHDEVLRGIVAAERARVTADAIDLVARAVTDMRRRAVLARVHLEEQEVAAIGTRGAAAVTELRRMLGLLRAEATARSADGDPSRPGGRWRRDGLIAGLVALVVLTDPWWTGSWELRPGDLVLCLPLVLRRSAPTLALTSAAALHAVLLALGTVPTTGFGSIAELILLGWTAGTAVRSATWVAGVAFGVAALAHWWVADPGNLAIGVIWVAGSAAVGRAWQHRDQEFERAHAATAAVRRTRRDAVADAVLAERLRIARELHDVTSHAVGVMVTQAGAAAALAPSDPVAARAALDVVESAAAQALVELDLLGHVLDVPATSGGSLDEELQQLATRIRSSGSDVRLRLRDLPTDPSLEAAVYRLVQEALTNVVRHAPGASAEVAVRRVGGSHVVMIRNPGNGAAPPMSSPVTPGFGLVGLAERVRALGGEFVARPAADGGFVVQALLPCVATEGVA